jgi:hypothetical protein
MDHVEYYQSPAEKVRPWNTKSMSSIQHEGPDKNGDCAIVKVQNCKRTRKPSNIKVTVRLKNDSPSKLINVNRVTLKK